MYVLHRHLIIKKPKKNTKTYYIYNETYEMLITLIDK